MWCSGLLRLLVREGDTSDDVRTKKFLFPLCAFVFLLGVFLAVSFSKDDMYTYLVGAVLCAFGSSVFMTGMVFNVGKAGSLLDALLVIYTLAICVLDLAAAASSAPFR
eukprot:Hpha_TRINITY_DN21061_c0_g1::TRINITY_DN21061_c0_g1_i1::g.103401::m.103401